MVFWKSKKKDNNPLMNSRDAAMALKSGANALVQDFSKLLTPVEVIMLNALVTYMDTFVLKCFVDNKLKHTTWITARLMEVKVILDASSSKEVKKIVTMITALEKLISAEKAVK